MTTNPPTVALIHATTAAIAPAAAAFADRFPEARLWNLLDDLLMTEADAAGGLTAPLRRRMRCLIAHAEDGGAAAILLTCSLYGPVAGEVTPARPRPSWPPTRHCSPGWRGRPPGGSPCWGRWIPRSKTP